MSRTRDLQGHLLHTVTFLVTPTFGLGTPVFPRISSSLHCGTPTFSKRCLWDSYFQNPSENPSGLCAMDPCLMLRNISE